ncbi:MAG: S24 family peptidase [bacterium]
MTDRQPGLGARLRRLREGKELTRAALAREAGVSPEEIERIETEETDPPVGLLRRIAGAAGLSLADLLALPPSGIECTVRILPAQGESPPGRDDLVPVPLVSGQVAGGNARIVDESVLGWLFLPREEFGHRSANLVAVQVFGRSMEPELPDGCIVAVDRNERTITAQGIYALREQDGGCTVKRVQVLDPAHVALVPSNRSEFRVEFWHLEPGESIEERLIGKVVWMGLNLLRTEEAAEKQPPYGRQDLGLARDLPPPKPKNREDEPF